jgi:RNA polymerase sigma-70 factor, ECF subfamily
MQKPDMPPDLQQSIINEFQADKNAFGKIYDHYYEMILFYLIKRTMSSEIGYDITADTFVKAFENFHKFKWKGVSIKSWLFKIAINNLKNYRRKPATTILTEEMLGMESLVTDTKEELHEMDKELFGDAELSQLSDAIATLKPEHQNVISLYYFSEMSQLEIAEALDKSVSAVKSIMHRAMNNLKTILSPNTI